MSEMVERVSAAIIANNERLSHSEAGALALAAIEAMRESSIPLRNKLEDLLDTHGREQLLEDSWSELIDAVLK